MLRTQPLAAILFEANPAKEKSDGNGKHIVHELIDVAPLFSTPNASKHCTAPDQDKDYLQVSSGLACFYTNADSLLNKRSELTAILSSAKTDVIAITEVYPKTHIDVDKSALELEDYDCFLSGQTGRGVCI